MPSLSIPSDGRVTNPFGADPALPGSPRHRGIDFGWGGGLNIYAAAQAAIVYAGPSGRSVSGAGWIDSGYGNIIVQDLGDGWALIYAHLSEILVSSGTPKRRARIAIMGTTGRSTGVHLHLELRKGGVAVDPAPYFTALAGGDFEPITLEEEDDMAQARYIRRLTGPGNKTQWGLVHPHLPGGAFLTQDILVANGFAGVAGDVVELTDGTWQATLNAAKLLADAELAFLAKAPASTPGTSPDQSAVVAALESLGVLIAGLPAEIDRFADGRKQAS